VGKWIIFFRRNLHGVPDGRRESWIARFRSVVTLSKVDEALLRRANLDIGVFFTSADREEIWRVGEILRSSFNLRDEDCIWSADFETERDWQTNAGPLWLLDRVEEALLKRDSLIAAKKYVAAERVQKTLLQPNLTRIRRYVQEQRIVTRKSMVITPVFQPLDYAFDPTTAFVLMPFGEKWSADVFHVIKRACEEASLRALRADDIFAPEIIINNIWRLINTAGIIVADITVHNANVFYELGIAHTLGKRVVLLRQKEGAVPPFDIAFWRHFEYGLTPLQVEAFKETLAKILASHRVNPPPKPVHI